MNQVGLVLEGGGMRGTYTAGVLDCFLDEGLHFNYVAGTSAGACSGSSYVAKQRGRNYRVMVEYGDHPEYISFKRLISHRQLFGMDFIFDTLPNQLVPFDYDSFMNRTCRFVVGATNMNTGAPVYFEDFPDRESLLKIMRASSSLPLIAPSISYLGEELMDGGISDPIPISQSIKDGNLKHVIVLTRNDGYIKPKVKGNWYFRRKFKSYPHFVRTLESRHFHYNQILEAIHKLERNQQALIIRPTNPLKVNRVERNRDKLHQLYVEGYKDAKKKSSELRTFIK
ncbi:patatin-like phospholipase family protein [Halobacillus sp. A5]|uniref:patatin-like phospholipase family protein n=1 Tax=Halobacillus sp. A5 TaxID=2880263 RepID=UPI0020A685CE|nr:patatin family protein [Halobacillus sp. A5]